MTSRRDDDVPFVVKLVITGIIWGILTAVGKLVPVEWLTWWVSALIAFVVVFGGILILSGDWD